MMARPDSFHMQESLTGKTVAFAALLFFALGFILFGMNLSSYFVIDDLALVHLGHKVAQDDPGILLRPDIGIYWRPVVKLSFAADGLVWGYKPLGYHLTNVISHCLCTLLVFLLAWKITRRKPIAWVAGVLFAVHPVHYYTVNWISARYDLFCTMFTLAGLVSLLQYGGGHRLRWIFGFVIFEILAIFSKELAFVFPALALVTVLATDGGIWKQRLKAYSLPLLLSFAVLGGIIALRVVAMGGIGGPGGPGGSLLDQRGPLESIVYILSIMPRVMLVPLIQHVFVPHRLLVLLRLAGALALFLLFLFWLKSKGRTRKLLPFVLMTGACAPFASFIVVPGSLEASYVFYLPSAFFALAVAWLLVRFRPDGNLARRSLFVVLVLVSMHLALLVHNNLVFAIAAKVSGAMHEQVVEQLGDDPLPGNVYLWDFPSQYGGVYFFFDEPSLMFLHNYDTTKVRFFVLNENYLARQRTNESSLGDAGVRVLRAYPPLATLATEFDLRVEDKTEELIQTLKEKASRETPQTVALVSTETVNGLKHAGSYEWLESVDWGTGESPEAGCRLSWIGKMKSGEKVGATLRFPDPMACEKVQVGIDPRWVLCDEMIYLSMERMGEKAGSFRLY